jgi:hypothetical protein
LVGANAVATEKADKSTSKMNGSSMLQLIIQIDSLHRHGRPAVIAFASMKVPDRTLSRKSRRFCFFERGMLSNSVSHTHRHVVILFPFIFSLSASIFVTHSLCRIDLPAYKNGGSPQIITKKNSHGLELNMNSAFSPSARAMLVSFSTGFLGDSFFR